MNIFPNFESWHRRQRQEYIGGGTCCTRDIQATGFRFWQAPVIHFNGFNYLIHRPSLSTNDDRARTSPPSSCPVQLQERTRVELAGACPSFQVYKLIPATGVIRQQCYCVSNFRRTSRTALFVSAVFAERMKHYIVVIIVQQ